MRAKLLFACGTIHKIYLSCGAIKVIQISEIIFIISHFHDVLYCRFSEGALFFVAEKSWQISKNEQRNKGINKK